MFDFNLLSTSVNAALAQEQKQVPNEVSTTALSIAEYRDFHSREGIELSSGVAAIDETIAAVEAIKSTDQTPNLDDIYRFSGFGPIRSVFDRENKAQDKRRKKLEALLTKEELEAAKLASLTSYHTDACITTPLWDALESIGFSHARVLEPSCGVGRFVAPMPGAMRDVIDLTMVELDSVSFEACEKLYPAATLLNKEFQDVKLPTQDLIVSNPPFNAIRTSDRTGMNVNNVKLHELFILKSLKLLRQGGLYYAVLPCSVMDSEDESTRRKISELANFVGGVRIPYQLFESKTNTKMSVDVLLFEACNEAEPNLDWIGVEQQTLGTSFYTSNAALGTERFLNLAVPTEGFLFGRNQVLWSQPDDKSDLSTAVYSACSSLFKDIAQYVPYVHEDERLKQESGLSITADIEPFTFGLSDDHSIVFRGLNGFELVETSHKAMKFKRVSGMIEIAEVANSLMALEASTSSPQNELDKTRAELNQIYDAYVKKYGYLSNRANTLAFGRDARMSTLYALEKDYKAGISRAKAKEMGVEQKPDVCEKAKIFFERAFLPWSLPTTAKSTEDALALSLAYSSKIDFKLIAKLTGQPERNARAELLGSSVFFDPTSKQFLLAEDYLSGDLVEKIKIARSHEISDPRMASNVAALLTAMPKPVEFADITASISAHWIPTDLVERFISDTYKVARQSVEISRSLGRTTVKFPMPSDAEVIATYGTPTHNPKQVLGKLMNYGEVIVKLRDCKGKVIGVDNEATALLKTAIKEIELAWLSFISTSDNSAIIEQNYNEKVNRFASFKAKFKHGYFPDLAPHFTPYPHQIAAVRRFLTQNDSGFLLNAAVGAGKTAVMAIACNMGVRLGLRQRCCLVCPAHLTGQIASEWLSLYPSDRDKLLVLDATSLSPKQRIDTLERIKTGGINYVIIPESTFKKINAPIEAQETMFSKRLNEIEDALTKATERFTVRDLENSKLSFKEELKRLSKMNDIERSICFASLNFDSLLVDEAHRAKNMGYHTAKLRSCKGIGSTTASQRSMDVQIKVQYLIETRKNPGVLMSTGTAISNSIVESYGWLRMLAPKLLSSAEIGCLDDFASTFISNSAEYELKADGSVGLVNRIRSFNNLEQLTAIFGCFSMTITSAELEHLLPTIKSPDGKEYPARPKLRTGAPISVITQIDKETLHFMESLVERTKNFKKSPIINDNALLVISDAKKASVSPQLVNVHSETTLSSKVHAMIQNTVKHYNEFQSEKGVQLLYVDLGTPCPKKDAEEDYCHELRQRAIQGDDQARLELDKKQHESRGISVNLYRHIIAELVSQGIEPCEIAIAQEFDTDAKKMALYERMRQGIVRVVLTSAEKMSTGANVQDRLVATHVLVAPFKPSDLEQLRGRAERVGNVIYRNRVESGQQDINPFELSLYYYGLERSTDSWLFQILESKASMIRQFTSGSDLSRSLTMDKDVLTFAELKAQVSGNNSLLKLMAVEKELFEQDVLYRNSMRTKNNAVRQIEKNQEIIKNLENAIDDCTKDFDNFKAQASSGIALTIGDVALTEINQQVGNVLFNQFADFRRVSKHSSREQEAVIAKLGNFDIVAVASIFGGSVKLVGVETGSQYLIDKGDLAKAKLLPSIIATVKNLPFRVQEMRKRISTLTEQNKSLDLVSKREFDISRLKQLELDKIALTREFEAAENAAKKAA